MTEIFSTEQWLDAFRDATQPRPGDSGNRTVSELADAMGIEPRKVRIRIAELLKQNRIISSWEKRASIDGLLRLRPVYRLKEGEEKK